MDEKTRRKRSYAAGYLLSLAGKPLPLTASQPGKEPVSYLYNGVRLPKLPEWDREMYPYAVILDTGWLKKLWFGAEVYYSGSAVGVRGGYIDYYCTSDMSGWNESTGGTEVLIAVGTNVDWTNFDVLGENGEVVLEASNPIPVYE